MLTTTNGKVTFSVTTDGYNGGFCAVLFTALTGCYEVKVRDILQWSQLTFDLPARVRAAFYTRVVGDGYRPTAKELEEVFKKERVTTLNTLVGYIAHASSLGPKDQASLRYYRNGDKWQKLTEEALSKLTGPRLRRVWESCKYKNFLAEVVPKTFIPAALTDKDWPSDTWKSTMEKRLREE